MNATLLVVTAALAFPPELGIKKDPYATDQEYRVPVLAISETGRKMITGSRVDVMLVEGFRTGNYTHKFVIENVRVVNIKPDAPLLGKPINMVTIAISERQLAELELAAPKGKLLLSLHPLVMPRKVDEMSETNQKGLLQKRYTDKK